MTVPDAAKANDRFSSYATSGLPSIRVLNRNACVAAAQAACCNTHGCTRCTTRADTSFQPLFHAPLRSASGGARSLKPMVGRGPRDQSSGQKPRARAPEVLACPAPVRFERARRREVGRGWIAAFTTESRSEPIFRGGFWGSVIPSAASRVVVTLSEKTGRGHLKNFASLVQARDNKDKWWRRAGGGGGAHQVTRHHRRRHSSSKARQPVEFSGCVLVLILRSPPKSSNNDEGPQGSCRVT